MQLGRVPRHEAGVLLFEDAQLGVDPGGELGAPGWIQQLMSGASRRIAVRHGVRHGAPPIRWLREPALPRLGPSNFSMVTMADLSKPSHDRAIPMPDNGARRQNLRRRRNWAVLQSLGVEVVGRVEGIGVAGRSEAVAIFRTAAEKTTVL